MMMLGVVLYFCIVLYCVQGFSYDYKYANNLNKTINITVSCNEKSPCIGKCCPDNHILVLNKSYNNSLSCLNNTHFKSLYNIPNLNDYSDVVFYENNVKQNIRKSNINMDHFTKLYSDYFTNKYLSFAMTQIRPANNKAYILKNGTVVMRLMNYLYQWDLDLPPHLFCVEHQIVLENDRVSAPALVIRILADPDGSEEEEFDKNTVTASALLVSCVFLLLVLAVYALLEQLRNLAGLMLMAHVSTLTTAFIFRVLQVLLTNREEKLPKATCVYLGLVSHYTVVASITWMNVMSFDIWWSMRGFRKMRQIHRRGIVVKFAWYALYGWGAPLLLILFMIVVENMDLTHLPNFVKPQYLNPAKCFIEEGETLVYLDGPIAIGIGINIVLFLMTAYNIWRIKEGVGQHSAGNSKRNNKDENRFWIYLKLSLVMGTNWILEIVSAFCNKDSWVWYIPDIFNALTGLFIFVIFICKKNIIVLLCKRLDIQHDIIRQWQAIEVTESSRLNSKNSRSSRRKMVDSVTETSDVDSQERAYYFNNAQLKLNDKPDI